MEEALNDLARMFAEIIINEEKENQKNKNDT